MPDQSPDPAGRPARHPQTALIAAGRPADEPGQPLNVPIIMASNFRAAQRGRTGGREYTRDHATPAWEALEEVAGELEGGEAVAFSSGMAAVAAVLDLVPAGALVVAPTDCYLGVHALLAGGQQQGRWRAELVDVTDTAAAAAAARRADLVWLESPTNPLLDVDHHPAADPGHVRQLVQSPAAGLPLAPDPPPDRRRQRCGILVHECMIVHFWCTAGRGRGSDARPHARSGRPAPAAPAAPADGADRGRASCR